MRAGVPPRVLVLDEEVPVPQDTGKRIRTFHLLTRLARSFEIDLLVHRDGATPEALAELMSRGIRVLVAPGAIPSKQGPGFPLRVLGNLVGSRLPYSVASHDTAAYRRLVRDTLDETDYDLVHCEWSPYAIHLRGCTRPAVISAHNVEAQVWRRLADASRGTPQGLVYRVQADRMANFERWAFGNAAFATAVSEPDALALGELGARDVTVVPNGVDLAFFRPPAPDVENDLVVFTGSMDWRPNQDGIRWYLDAVHPRLRGRIEAPLVVVGRNPPAWLAADRLPPDVEVTGSVPDVRPYVERAAVFIVPLRAGGGSRLKILEALAAGRAVVSTTVGAEGLDLEDGKHLVLADTAETFAAAVEGLMHDRDRAHALGLAGRKRVEERYGWDAIAELQAGVWRRAAASGS